jgi:hypothetical protein
LGGARRIEKTGEEVIKEEKKGKTNFKIIDQEVVYVLYT